MRGKDLVGARLGFEEDALDLLIDEPSGLLACISLLYALTSEKHVLLALVHHHWPELIAHPPLTYHPACQLGGAFEVVTTAGGQILENQLFGYPPPSIIARRLSNSRRLKL